MALPDQYSDLGTLDSIFGAFMLRKAEHVLYYCSLCLRIAFLKIYPHIHIVHFWWGCLK